MALQDSKVVRALYESPSGTKRFTFPLASGCPVEPSADETTTYLSELRSNTKRLQDDINTFLTDKMAQDKARDVQAEAGHSTSRTKRKDELEEENYGEEVVGDEE